MTETTRRIIQIPDLIQTYQVNGVTYRIRPSYEKNNHFDFRQRMLRCLMTDKNVLTRTRENDIIQAGTVYSAAQKEEIA